MTIAAFIGAVTFSLSPLNAAMPYDESLVSPEFKGIDTWLNSEPLSMQAMRGEVVLIDFWTYTCISCLNHFQYIQGWHERYRDEGLVVYWPSGYLIDKQGRVVYSHAGEGLYAETEREIMALLAEQPSAEPAP